MRARVHLCVFVCVRVCARVFACVRACVFGSGDRPVRRCCSREGWCATGLLLRAGLAAGTHTLRPRSYGYHRVEVLGALASIMIIWLVTGILVVEAVQRVITPETVNGKGEEEEGGGARGERGGRGGRHWPFPQPAGQHLGKTSLFTRGLTSLLPCSHVHRGDGGYWGQPADDGHPGGPPPRARARPLA